MEIMLLWQLSEQLNQSIHLSLFEAHSINASEFAQLIEQADSDLSSESHPWYHYTQQLISSCIANITGCQRLSFNQGQFVVDIYFGDTLSNVQSVPYSQQGSVANWHCLPHTTQSAYLDQHLTEKLFWQMGRLSQDDACIYAFNETLTLEKLAILARKTGFTLFSEKNDTQDDISLCERKALRQSLLTHYAYCLPDSALHNQSNTCSDPKPPNDTNKNQDDKAGSIAIIGGGIAAAHLALSLAEKNKNVTIYCKDKCLADGASGNKQGAIYPLLTPDNSLMSQYFQLAFLYSRRRLQELTTAGHQIGHQFCGVLQTGFDERSDTRLNKIMDGQPWPNEIAFALSPSDANRLANIQIDKPAFYYPLAGWICPHEFASAAIKQAQKVALSKGNTVMVKLLSKVTELTQEPSSSDENAIKVPTDKQPSTHPKFVWRLTTKTQNDAEKSVQQEYHHEQVVVASGAQLTELTQTRSLQVTGFRGQVSHIPSKGKLAELNTVICAHGYLTPENNQHHCVGASYVKSPDSLEYCPDEQQDNAQKMHHSFPDRDWVNDVDVSDAKARVGVRMVTRDHCPMMGLAPDIDAIFEQYNTEPLADHQLTVASRKFWRHQPAPTYQGLYILGGLGSRGLSSGPLAAESLASIICEQTPPISYDMFAMLNPNRMWLRKLLKGKSLMV